ncbi:hypothetical protein ACHAPU_011279 [Fusarium lateritium]
MGVISGTTDDTRQFNGKLLSYLCANRSKRLHWTPSDYCIMYAWLSKHRHSDATLTVPSPEGLSDLMAALGIVNVSEEHRAELQTRLISSLRNSVAKFKSRGGVREIWVRDKGEMRVFWNEGFLDELMNGVKIEDEVTVEVSCEQGQGQLERLPIRQPQSFISQDVTDTIHVQPQEMSIDPIIPIQVVSDSNQIHVNDQVTVCERAEMDATHDTLQDQQRQDEEGEEEEGDSQASEWTTKRDEGVLETDQLAEDINNLLISPSSPFTTPHSQRVSELPATDYEWYPSPARLLFPPRSESEETERPAVEVGGGREDMHRLVDLAYRRIVNGETQRLREERKNVKVELDQTGKVLHFLLARFVSVDF